MFFYFVEIIISNVRIKSSRNLCSRDFRHLLISLEWYSKFNERNHKKVINYMLVFDAKIINSLCNIKKFCNKYECIFATRFIQKFASLDYDIRNHIKRRWNYLRFDYRNRKSCWNFRKIDREYSSSNRSHSHKNENWTNNFSNINTRICIKINEKILDSTNRLRSNLQTLQTKLQFQ